MHTRREFMRTGAVAAGALSFGPAFWTEALAAPAKAGPGPYGPLGPPDANGISLPQGFTAREIARGGAPVQGTGYVWHIFSDGAATYATGDGGWILVSNSEIPSPVEIPGPVVGELGEGGASAIRFGPDGAIQDAYRILEGTSSNCAGGPTPWGTWMSCEEHDEGMVWECDPTGEREAVARPALGVFSHEAACVDPKTGNVYLTEDEGDGGFYRFKPVRKGDLSEGRLSIARVGKRGAVQWIPVPDPSASALGPTRKQVPGSTKFRRGEGIWFDSGIVYIATTGDSTIRAYDTRKRKVTPVYDPKRLPDPPLTDVDNVTVARSGDLFVCEDNGAPDGIDIAIITPKPNREVARFARLSGTVHGGDPSSEVASEATGVVFDPSGTRMYFASQRAYGPGAVYEVSGPFRG